MKKRRHANHKEVAFTHCICPDCYEKVVRPEIGRLKSRGKPS